MTDPWARPADGERGPVFEIPLTDGRLRAGGSDDRPDRDERASGTRRRRRRIVVLGAVLAAMGAAVAVTAAGDDGGATDGAATTFDASELSTPPTLATLPPATLPEERTASQGVPTVPVEPTLDASTVTVPEFAVVAGSDAADLDGYDLAGAVAANAARDTPARTFLRLDGVQAEGLFTTSADVTVSSDPATGRDSLVITRDVGEGSVIIADRSAEAVYRTDDGMDGRWERFGPGDFTAGTGTDDLGALFDSFVTGPITQGAIDAARIGTGEGNLVRLNGGAIARRYAVTVPIEALRPYGLLLVANIFGGTVDDGVAPEAITFEVYVTDQPALALVAARFDVGGTVYLLQQFFDRRPANVIIDLPGADEVIDGAVTGAPATAPSTVPGTTLPTTPTAAP